MTEHTCAAGRRHRDACLSAKSQSKALRAELSPAAVRPSTGCRYADIHGLDTPTDQRFHCGCRHNPEVGIIAVGVVVADVGSGVAAVHVQVDEQLSDGLAGHGRAPVGVHRPGFAVGADDVVDEFGGQLAVSVSSTRQPTT